MALAYVCENIYDKGRPIHRPPLTLLFPYIGNNRIDVFRTPQPCGMQATGPCGNMIGGWTVGAVGDCIEGEVGFRIGASTFRRALLQVRKSNIFK